ncbi:MAG: hypothetical protein IPG05_14525 [Gemmatimonadetes bacterium]|nr:hypothetical protein [Gemmatimonadota bacterium]
MITVRSMLGVLAAITLGVFPGHAVPGGNTSTNCWPAEKELSDFEIYVRGVVAHPILQDLRNRLGLKTMPADSVIIIRDDALCARAGLLFPSKHASVQRIRLARLGSVYWAEDGSKGGEWTIGLLADSTLTKVLHRPSR